MGILRGGQLVALEDLESLLAKGGKRVQIRSPDGVADEIAEMDGTTNVTAIGEGVQFTYVGDYNTLLRQLSAYDILEIDIREPPIEDVFMHFYDGGDGAVRAAEVDSTTEETRV